jgi:imidazolonepropionase-like amidohydrolase
MHQWTGRTWRRRQPVVRESVAIVDPRRSSTVPRMPQRTGLATLLRVTLLALPAVPLPASAQEAVLLRDATIVHVDEGRVSPRMSVLVRDGRVVAVEAEGRVRPERGTRVIDLDGAFVLPGLIDSHQHMRALAYEDATGDPRPARWRYFAWLNLANGVTGVRVPGADLEADAAIRERVRRGEWTGPRIWLTGEKVGHAEDPKPVAVRTPEEAAHSVRRLQARRADLVKLNYDLRPELWFAAARASREAGLPIVSHVPQHVPLTVAIDSGLVTLEHLFGYPEETSENPDRIRRLKNDRSLERLWERTLVKLRLMDPPPSAGERALATHSAARRGALFELLRSHSTWVTPTLTLHAGVSKGWDLARVQSSARWLLDFDHHDFLLGRSNFVQFPEQQRTFGFEAEMVRRLDSAGVGLLAGSDAPTLGPSGFALHDELGLLVRVGLTPARALRTATTNPARALGADSLGAVRAGAAADLLVVRRNPLEDIAATREIVLVVAQGRVHDRRALDAMLDSALVIARLNRDAQRSRAREP